VDRQVSGGSSSGDRLEAVKGATDDRVGWRAKVAPPGLIPAKAGCRRADSGEEPGAPKGRPTEASFGKPALRKTRPTANFLCDKPVFGARAHVWLRPGSRKVAAGVVCRPQRDKADFWRKAVPFGGKPAFGGRPS